MANANSWTGGMAGNGKGKDKDKTAGVPPVDGQPESEHQKASATSFTERITDSAVHLAQSLLSGPPDPRDLAGVSSSSKDQQTSASNNSKEPSFDEESSSVHRRQPLSSVSAAGETFRSRQTEEHTKRSELELSAFLDNTNVLQSPETTDGAIFETAWLSTLGLEQADRGGAGALASATGWSIGEQEAHDGSEVVNLLSAPETDIKVVDEDVPLSQKYVAALKAAFSELDGPPRDWDNSLNLIPDFVRPDPAGDVSTPRGENTQKSAQTASVFGLEHTPDVGRLWVDQWERVLTHYNLDVWAWDEQTERVEKLITESKNKSTELAPSISTAVKRLKLILGHTRGC